MSTAFAPSDMLKDSSIKWARKVRQDFDVKPLFTVLEENKQKNDLKEDYEVLSLSYGKLVVKNKDDNKGLLSASNDTYQKIEPGYIVLRLTDLQNDQRSLRVGLAKDEGIITSAYVGLKSKSPHLNTKYLYYLLHSYDLMKVFYGYGGGIRQGMSYSDLKKLPLILPGETEQLRIINFLDNKLSKIDKFIVNKQKHIDKLLEIKKSVVNNAVTKGIDENISTKPSGTDWIGDIPASWITYKLRYLVKFNPTRSSSKHDTEEKVVFLPMEAIEVDGSYSTDILRAYDEVKSGYSYFEEGDVVIAKITPCFENGKGAYLKELPTKIGYGTTEFHVLRPDSSKILGEYLYLYTMTHYFRTIGTAFMTGSAGQQRVSSNFVKDFPIGLPSPKEQRRILEYIHTEAKVFDKAIDKAKRQIKLIKEYRDSLITHAVTGQIEIRE